MEAVSGEEDDTGTATGRNAMDGNGLLRGARADRWWPTAARSDRCGGEVDAFAASAEPPGAISCC